MTPTNVKPKPQGLPVMAIMLLCILVASCGVLSKKEEPKQTGPVPSREQSTYIEITKISDPITPEGMKPIEYTGKMVKQDHSMYPEYVDSLKKGLIVRSDDYSYFKGEYLDSIPVIIQKVFPDVYFLTGKTSSTRSPKLEQGIVAYYKGKYVGCIWDFNDLYFRMNHETDVLLNEKILAIFVIRNNMDENINIKISNIAPIEERQIEKTGYKINYKFDVNISGASKQEDFYKRNTDKNGTWYFYDDRGMILNFGYFNGNQYKSLRIFPVSSTLVVRSVHATDCKVYFAITPLKKQKNIKLTT